MDLPKNSDRMQRIEIYKNRIELEMNLYIESLPDQSLIYKVGPFRGMLKHIAISVFKSDKALSRKTDRNINFSDPMELDRLWDLFVSICYLYNQNISIQNFCMMLGIDPRIVSYWLNGDTRNNNNLIDNSIIKDMSNSGEIVLNNSSLYSELVKKWLSECEQNLSDHAARENSIGSIFLLKSVYGYSEQPQRIEIAASAEKVDRAALMDKYKDQVEPEKPKLTDNIDK